MQTWIPSVALVAALQLEPAAPTAPENPAETQKALARQAIAFRDQGQLDEAAGAFQQAADQHPSIRPFLLVELVKVREARGEFIAAADLAQLIAREHPTSSAATTARLRLPALYASAGNLDQAVASVEQAGAIKINELTEAGLVEVAEALDRAGCTDLASRIRLRLLREFPQGRFTEKTFDQLTIVPQSPLSDLSFEETLALAERLARLNRFPEALELLESARKRFPRRRTTPLLQYMRIRSLFNSRQYEQVIRSPRLAPGDQYYLAAELLRARAHWRIDQNREFLTLTRRIIAKYPRSPEAIEAKLQLSRYYSIDQRDYRRAAAFLEQVIAASGHGSEGERLWNLGWIYTLAGDDEKALQTYASYIAAYPDADYTTNALFWSGKIHERRGNVSERDAALQKLIATYPYAYYSYRARQILGVPPEAPMEVSNGLAFPSTESSDERMGVVSALQELGLTEYAVAELRLIAGDAPSDPALTYRLAEAYVAAGQPLRAIGLLQRSFRDIIRHGGTNVPARFWEILYPRMYWTDISAAAQKVMLDPYLVSSIIRQESGFEPTVVSSAGAVGLMQIMPEEAGSIAARAGLQNGVTRQELFDPRMNVVLGVTEYVQKLEAMNGNQIFAIASYNAGEAAVGQWIARTPLGDLDVFIDSIPFNETRLYVKNVIRNHYEYRRIYGNGSAS